jgi:hypothetical protein
VGHGPGAHVVGLSEREEPDTKEALKKPRSGQAASARRRLNPSGYNQTDGTLGMLRFLRIHPAYRGYQMSEAYH